MVSVSILSAATALLALGAAAPAHSNGFSVQLQSKNQGWKLNGMQKTAQVYRKYNKQMPAVVSAAAAKQTGTVVTTPSDSFDDEFDAPVTVGGQPLTLDFDTGSADL